MWSIILSQVRYPEACLDFTLEENVKMLNFITGTLIVRVPIYYRLYNEWSCMHRALCAQSLHLWAEQRYCRRGGYSKSSIILQVLILFADYLGKKEPGLCLSIHSTLNPQLTAINIIGHRENIALVTELQWYCLNIKFKGAEDIEGSCIVTCPCGANHKPDVVSTSSSHVLKTKTVLALLHALVGPRTNQRMGLQVCKWHTL